MKITVIGATGMIGQRVVAEAVSRGHQVVAGSRSGASVGGAQGLAIDLQDTRAVAEQMAASDATVVSVSPPRDGSSHEPTIASHRALIEAQPAGRLLVVGGAGSLRAGDRELRQTEGFPLEYKPEADTFAAVLDLYRNSSGLDWTLLCPAPEIAPGTRTGSYATELDVPAGERISAEDFAVALVDEVERPAHRQARFTVAN
ncbi:NAD(P)H-binding protein [Calidifontibacter sp. DB0510]|uniref:NAD(P)H-binding protein n=1 Tax=Metallococcus carri TaxID=1656884 RepID=A0A967B8K7_9MICO|nr:NAD(P)H-binding protein [Metallococcus carri]NHN56786.1 NAD(P)H-binding protein [Metallococcus carri]NOP37837.1 NAD(P)H-binding protein [Calidifontibacter sp. DB2511S]